ncbi:MAG: hypothetical protein KAH57_05510, partial [Thermoplasmata archaeon]|nr:hypothetical protein [Thermoplasmata archaeon]
MNSQLVPILLAVILVVSLPAGGDNNQNMGPSEVLTELEFEESDNNEPEFNEYEIPTRSNQFGKIHISDNDDLKDFIVEHGFNGSGSVDDPYLIDDLIIKEKYEGPIISIKWISLHLIMRN